MTSLSRVPSCHCTSESDAVSALCSLLVSCLEPPGPPASPQVSAVSQAERACALPQTLCLAWLHPGVRLTLGGEERRGEGRGRAVCRLLALEVMLSSPAGAGAGAVPSEPPLPCLQKPWRESTGSQPRIRPSEYCASPWRTHPKGISIPSSAPPPTPSSAARRAAPWPQK